VGQGMLPFILGDRVWVLQPTSYIWQHCTLPHASVTVAVAIISWLTPWSGSSCMSLW